MALCQECLEQVGGDERKLPCNSPYADGECWKGSEQTPIKIQLLKASSADKPGQPED